MTHAVKLVVVAGVGLVGYTLWRQQQAKNAAAAAAAAAQRRTTSAKSGIVSDLSGLLRSGAGQATLTSAVGGLSKWLGGAGQVDLQRSASTSLGASTALTGGYFVPGRLGSMSSLDGIGSYGDDSNSGAVVTAGDGPEDGFW